MKIRILLVDDHKLLLRGIRAMLSDYPELEIVGESYDGRAGVEKARELSPDVVVMDVMVPGLSGPAATSRIVKECPRTRVLALSMHSDSCYVSKMLSAGASGYVLKTCDVQELVQGIKTVHGGEVYLAPQVAGTVVEGYLNGGGSELLAEPRLSEREAEVLQLLAEGRNSKQIGQLLHVSSRTVDSHRQRIMEKLDTHSVAGLTKCAIRAGLTSLEI